MSDPLVLGIETSCDETAVGIVRGRKLLANVIASSVDEHARFGGVVPEVASRAHLEAMQPTIEKALKAEGLSPEKVAEGKQWWAAANLIVQNIGAFFGMMAFARVAQTIGRKPTFFMGFLLALGATWFFYKNFQSKSDIWMSAVMGFCQLGLFAGFAIYLPELFPTRLRSEEHTSELQSH